ncbi:MAG: hypothetical protein H0V00_06905 [Chloroflexia bacterium]|nr:hypothetical protein [Chloroflexia bacterium]
MVRVMLAYAVVVSLILPNAIGVVAQESPQDSPAAQLLPDPSDLGAGWTLHSGALEDAGGNPSFTSLSGAAYVGPNGGRVFTVVFLVAEGPAAAREAWQFANTVFDEARLLFAVDYADEQSLKGSSALAGCADMRRTDGTEKMFPLMAVGLTLCVADPDLIVLAYVSGEINGLTGIAASDRVVEIVLDSSGREIL